MILDEIVAHKRLEIAQAEKQTPLETVMQAALEQGPAADFAPALAGPGIGIIAEIKRASPSRGPLFPNLDPSHLALDYVRSGASAISVLTDRQFFAGSLEDLASAARTCRDGTTSGRRVPVMRKDFILSPYQVYEARAYGADALLLIARILDDTELAALLGLARKLGMEALVETHTRGEVERAVACGARIVGINNRDLSTFQTDISLTERLRPYVPEGCVVVSESGIHSRSDVERLQKAGVDAVLVGEALVRSGNAGRVLEKLVGNGR